MQAVVNEVDTSGLSNVTLDNFRTDRFHGRSRCCSLSDFTSEHRALLERLYGKLSEFHEFVSAEPVAQRIRTPGMQYGVQIQELISALGGGPKDKYSSALRNVLHDVLGGSLTVLRWLLEDDLGDPEPKRTTRFLASDHLKIMRNAIHGLDDDARALDLGGGLHGVGYLRERWSGAKVRNDRGAVQIDFSSNSDIAFAENCFEFSTVQRVIYNLLTNACTHTVDQRVDFDVSEVEAAGSKNIRFLISNVVSGKLKRRLRDASSPFDIDFSTSGGGLGLSICADLVTEAYGLESAMVALTDQYVGVEVQGSRVVSWFHWPAVSEDG